MLVLTVCCDRAQFRRSAIGSLRILNTDGQDVSDAFEAME